MYIGEGEAMLRDVFARARLASPSIVLLDEVDAVAGEWAGKGSMSQLTLNPSGRHYMFIS
jgi:ATP-dependent 26S proteasome regulatory subunit